MRYIAVTGEKTLRAPSIMREWRLNNMFLAMRMLVGMGRRQKPENIVNELSA